MIQQIVKNCRWRKFWRIFNSRRRDTGRKYSIRREFCRWKEAGWKNISESNEEDNVTNLVENPSSEEIGSTESVSETQETKVGWVQDGEEKYYYKEDGTPAEGFTEIDGKTYYFDSNGRMYKNTTFGSYDETDDFYKTYRVDNQGELVKGWYTDEYDNVYYYDSNGVQAQGLTEINGKLII